MTLLAALGLASMLFAAWFTMRAYGSVDGGAQSRRAAIIEAWVNIVTGFTLNFFVNLLVIPLATEGGHLSAINNWHMGWIFTVVSMLRQYGIRRWFAVRIHLFAARAAERLS